MNNLARHFWNMAPFEEGCTAQQPEQPELAEDCIRDGHLGFTEKSTCWNSGVETEQGREPGIGYMPQEMDMEASSEDSYPGTLVSAAEADFYPGDSVQSTLIIRRDSNQTG